jgi:O-antigen ligase
MAVATTRAQGIPRAGARMAVELWRLARRFGPTIAAAGVVGAVGIADGGFDTVTWRLSTIALLAFAAAGLVGRDRISLTRADVAMLAGFAALALWVELSRFWSTNPSQTLPELERTLVYVSLVAAVLLAVAVRDVAQLAVGTLLGITAAALYGLVPYLFNRVPLNPVEGKLLFEPLGYANGVGIYAAMGIVLSVGLALGAHRRLTRAAVLAPLIALVPALYLTSSRGAWIALAAGLTATIYLLGRLRARVVASILVLAVVAGLLLGSTGGQPLSLVGANRPHYWRVAWIEYKAHPVLGSGAGTFSDYWLHHRRGTDFARDAHSLYLESLAELGLIGVLLLAVALAAPLVAIRRPTRAVLAGLAGAYVAFVVHAAVDWDWELPAVTLTGLLCGAAVVVDSRRGGRHLSRELRAGLLLAALSLGTFTSIRLAHAGLGI